MNILSRIMISFMLRQASATLMALSTSQYPYLALLSPAGPVEWHKKSFSLAMAQAEAVRISPRGLQFIHSSQLVVSEANNWHKTTCRRSPIGMCEVEKDGVTTVFFPIYGASVMMDNLQSVPAEHWVHYLPTCTEGITVRTSIVGNAAQKRRDVSLCDVLGGGGDFVYLPASDTIFFKAKPISFQMFSLISVMTVYLAVILAHNLEVTLGSKKEQSNILVTEMVVIVQIFLLLFASGGPVNDIMSVFVTIEVHWFFIDLYLFFHKKCLCS